MTRTRAQALSCRVRHARPSLSSLADDGRIHSFTLSVHENARLWPKCPLSENCRHPEWVRTRIAICGSNPPAIGISVVAPMLDDRQGLTRYESGDVLTPSQDQPAFGVLIPKSCGPELLAAARHAEALGFDLVTVHPDHLHGVGPSLETWTAITWATAHTRTIGIAPSVLSLPYRHPALIAKMVESLDRLSGGRIVLAMGAGADVTGAFRALGLAQHSAREKVEVIEEAIDVIRGLWSGSAVSYPGKHFILEQASIEPAAARPIPIWLGVFGPRMARLVGRKADGWLPSLFLMGRDLARERIKQVREAAHAAGRDPDDLVYGCNVRVLVDPRARSGGGQIAGPAEAVAAELAGLVGCGFTFLNLWPGGEGAEQRERIAQDVIPAVRKAVAR